MNKLDISNILTMLIMAYAYSKSRLMQKRVFPMANDSYFVSKIVYS